jgi:hypothetical protein
MRADGVSGQVVVTQGGSGRSCRTCARSQQPAQHAHRRRPAGIPHCHIQVTPNHLCTLIPPSEPQHGKAVGDSRNGKSREDRGGVRPVGQRLPEEPERDVSGDEECCDGGEHRTCRLAGPLSRPGGDAAIRARNKRICHPSLVPVPTRLSNGRTKHPDPVVEHAPHNRCFVGGARATALAPPHECPSGDFAGDIHHGFVTLGRAVIWRRRLRAALCRGQERAGPR